MSDFVLFGVTGDLARKRLIPALARAWEEGGIPESSRFVGFGRKKFSRKEFQKFIFEYAPGQSTEKKAFSEKWQYIHSELDDKKGYESLKVILDGKKITKKVAKNKTENAAAPKAVIYISLSPKFQFLVAGNLFSAGVLNKNHKRVLAIEKPFGGDSVSAKKLNAFLLKNISESHVYRIDHYAGKQELMNIEQTGKLGVLSFMDGKNIKEVEIKFLEKGTAAGRGALYDHVGALNDVCQNHVLYMLGTVLAAPYAELPEYHEIRAGVLKYLKIKGKPVLAQYEVFHKEDGVDPKSRTETYFKIENVMSFDGGGSKLVSKKLKEIEKDLKKRWQGLKVTLIGGKAMKEDMVSICFHGKTKNALMPEDNSTCIVTSRHGSKDAYQTIFEAILRGDRSRSVDISQVVEGWKYVESVKRLKPALNSYRQGDDKGGSLAASLRKIG